MPIPTYEERVGTLLGGKYRVGKVVGRGGMGAVFEGVHEGTGRPVAVKVLNHEHVENPDAAERFLREARVVAGLKHPNVVDVLDLGEEPDRTVYMVLELLEGEVFARTLHREKTLSYARAAEVLVPVMRAVAYAHTRNVVHRDIKPENIFLHRDAEGNVVPKILDFGIAKALDDERDQHMTQTGYLMGTPAYMSPEQGEGIPSRIGPPADVWSMGVVWYEALTGEMPFEGPSHTAVLLAVNSGKFTRLVKRLASLSVPIANAIDKAMVRDAARRYPDMGAFLDALQRAAAEGGDGYGRPSAPAYSRASLDRVSPLPGGPDTLDTPADALRDDVMELGPVARSHASDAITLGDETQEPVVLLSNPRRKKRPRPVAAIAAAVIALAGLGLTVAALSRRSAPPTTTARPALRPTAAVAPVETPTPSPDASVAPVEAAPTLPEPAVRAPASRHGRHGSRGAREEDPVVPPPPPAQPVAVQPPPPPVQPPPEAPPAHHGHREPASVPNENAPITDYDHAP